MRPHQRITGHAAARAVLAHPDFVVPPVPPATAPGGIEWLRATVCRFSNGEAHRWRRELVTDALAGLDPAVLRRRAGAHTGALLAAGGSMTEAARTVPVRVLAEALELPEVPPEEVGVVAAAYHPGSGSRPDVDRAVARLVDRCGGVADESAAALIAILVQAYAATAGLLDNAVAADGPDVLAVLTETLRFDPPVRVLRRRAEAEVVIAGTHIPAGTLVELDLVAANRDPAVFTDPRRWEPGRADRDHHLTFGAGPRACPGRDLALAMAAGILDAGRERTS